MRKPIRFAVVAAVVAAYLAVGCFDDPSGPDGSSSRGSTASFALDPRFPPIMVAASASDVEPFDRVRVTIIDDAGAVRFNSVIVFPDGSEEVELPARVQLPPGTGDAGVSMTLSMQYINAQGDTVFRGGPTRITILPDRDGGVPQPVSIDIVHSGAGANAARVVISPAGGTAVAGMTTIFTATAFDQPGNPIPGTPVVFTTPDPELAGLASAASGAVTWGAARGAARIVATLLNGRADTASFQVILPATRVVVVSGDGQSGTAGNPLLDPIVVRAEAADGIGVAGVNVNFAVMSGGGSVSAASVVTDADGFASVAWTLGDIIGPQSLGISAAIPGSAGSSVGAFAVPRIPAQLTITSAPGQVVAGQPFDLAVAVRDAGGDVVTSYTEVVSINLDPGVGPLGASLGGTLAVQAVAGVATFSGLSMTVAGLSRLVATSGELPSTSADVSVIPAAPSALIIAGGDNQAGVVGEALPVLLTVRLRDAFGNGIAGATINFSALAGGPAVEPASAVTNSLGNASTKVVLGTVTGIYTVSAAVSGMDNVSASFTITAMPGAAETIELVSGDGQSFVLGSAVEAAPFIVRVVDAHGNGVGGHPISWAIVSDVSASLDEDFTLTDAAGEAIVTLTLPLFDVGPVEVEAIASGLAGSPALFTVTMLSMPSSPLSAWVHNAPAQAPPPPPPPSRTRVPSVMASPGYRMTASPLRIRADASLTGQA